MVDMLDRANEHLFLEEQRNDHNSFIANVNILVNDLDNIDIVAGSIDNVNAVGENITEVINVSTNMSHIITVENNLPAITTVSNSIDNVNKVGNNINEVVIVAANINTINQVATGLGNISTVANSIDSVNTVAGIKNDVITVSANAGKISTVVTSLPTITNVSNNLPAITNVNNQLPNIIKTANNIDNIDRFNTYISESLDTIASDKATVIRLRDEMEDEVVAFKTYASKTANEITFYVQDVLDAQTAYVNSEMTTLREDVARSVSHVDAIENNIKDLIIEAAADIICDDVVNVAADRALEILENSIEGDTNFVSYYEIAFASTVTPLDLASLA